MNRPSLERVQELLLYCPDTGNLTWRVDRISGKGGGRIVAFAGGVAGTFSLRNGIVISIDGRQYKAHMLAWLLVNGRWPALLIDHKDGDKRNNRWLNLRAATPSINTQNMRRAMVTNLSSGLLGVSRTRSKTNPWRAQIRISGRITHLGSFPTPDAAHEAYVKAKRIYHEGCTL